MYVRSLTQFDFIYLHLGEFFSHLKEFFDQNSFYNFVFIFLSNSFTEM